MSDLVYLLVPVHNRRETTLRFVDALRRQTYGAFKLVLVDDGSTDGTAEAVRSRLDNVEVIRGDGTWWWAGSMEAARCWLAQAGVGDGAVVGFLNDDVEFDEGFLAEIIADLDRHPHALVLARQLDRDGREVDAGGGVRVDRRHLRFDSTADPARINCLPTRGLFLRWGDFKRIGGFRPRWLQHYLADYEFTLRAHRLGFPLLVADAAAVRTDAMKMGLTRATLLQHRRRDRLRWLFSPRFTENPQSWLAFAWLAGQPGWRPWLTMKVFVNSVFIFAQCLILPVRAPPCLDSDPK